MILKEDLILCSWDRMYLACFKLVSFGLETGSGGLTDYDSRGCKRVMDAFSIISDSVITRKEYHEDRAQNL